VKTDARRAEVPQMGRGTGMRRSSESPTIRCSEDARDVDSSTDPTSRVDVIDNFEALYRQHGSAVLRYAIKCVGRPEIAEEIASEAFLLLYREGRRIDSGRLPPGYSRLFEISLRVIGENLWLNRKTQRNL